MKYFLIVCLAAICLASISPENSRYINAGNEFAIQLYQKLIEDSPNNNLVFSPFSTQQAIAMAYFGASGNTQKQIQETLGFSANKEDVNAYFKTLNNKLNIQSDSVNFTIANGLWAHKQYTFLPEYFNQVTKSYNAPVELVNFTKTNQRNKVIKNINKWVAEQTKNNITELLSNNDLSDLTRLVIANAIWFKADWLKAFNPKTTEKKEFKNLNGKTSIVEMMQQKADFNYFENNSMQAIELTYQGEQFSMLVLMPRDLSNFSLFEKNITSKSIKDIEEKMNNFKVNIHFPKFKTQTKFNLKNTLSEIGMPQAFSDSANFSAMTGNTDLRIDKIIHKANIEVNESGAEASAATAVIMVRKSAIIREMKFNANHPFVYIIKNNETGSFLFVGRYVLTE